MSFSHSLSGVIFTKIDSCELNLHFCKSQSENVTIIERADHASVKVWFEIFLLKKKSE